MGNIDVLARFERWLLSTDRSDDTIRLRMGHVRRLAIRHELLEVTPDDLEAIMANRRHLADETRKSELASWRVFYSWTMRKGLRTSDPTTEIDSIKVKPRMPKIAPDAAVADALEGATDYERAMILLGRGAWLRLNEITTLHTRDRVGDVLVIRGKGGRERVVPLNGEVAAALDVIEAAQGPGYYFRGEKGEHMHKMSVNKIITRRLGHNPHSLRHAGATAGYRETRNLRATQEMLGHASSATTQRYTHLTDEERRELAEASRVMTARLAA